jgi:hypothetical protein
VNVAQTNWNSATDNVMKSANTASKATNKKS